MVIRARQFSRRGAVLDFLVRLAGWVCKSQPVSDVGIAIPTVRIAPAYIDRVDAQPIIVAMLRVIELPVGEDQPGVGVSTCQDRADAAHRLRIEWQLDPVDRLVPGLSWLRT